MGQNKRGPLAILQKKRYTVSEVNTPGEWGDRREIMKQTFQVTGMTCSACSANVERAVKKLSGVEHVEVSLLANRMTVDYDPEKTGRR